MPIRIQRKRTKGWKKPIGAVNCTRPGNYGNPFTVEKYGLEKSLKLFDMFFTESTIYAFPAEARQDAMSSKLFTHYKRSDFASTTDMIVKELKGKDLMCFCPFDKPCHANILLVIANQ